MERYFSCDAGNAGNCEMRCAATLPAPVEMPLVPLVVRSLNRKWFEHGKCEPFLTRAIKGISRHYGLSYDEAEEVIDEYILSSDDCFPFSFFEGRQEQSGSRINAG